MGKYFGTDGIRGRYGVQLTKTLAFQLGQGLKEALNTTRLVIGMDTRESSDDLMQSVISGAQSAGIDVMVAGVVTTPMISLFSYEKQITGVMITASHNPYKDNGIKVFDKGRKLSLDQERALEMFLDSGQIIEAERFGELFDGEPVFDTYIDLIESLNVYKTDIRIGVDSANGANYLISRGIFQELTESFYQMGDNPDGKNINDNVGSTHIEAMQEFVKKWHLDIGFSFDGDGDRVLVVDADGSVIDGDLIIYVIATHLKRQGLLKHNTVVLTKMSNLGIIKAFEKQGINVVLTDVGDKYVLEAIEEGGYSVGGENSGHIILRSHLHTGDGLLVALKLLEVLQESGATLNELLGGVTMWPQKLVNIRTFSRDILDNPQIQKVVNDVSGTLKGRGKLLVRMSGTEPLIRVTVSCESEEELDLHLNRLLEVIQKVKEEV
jgi:phosphoglucosamine mutase